MFLLLLHNNLDLCCYVDGDVPVSASPPQQFRLCCYVDGDVPVSASPP